MNSEVEKELENVAKELARIFLRNSPEPIWRYGRPVNLDLPNGDHVVITIARVTPAVHESIKMIALPPTPTQGAQNFCPTCGKKL